MTITKRELKQMINEAVERSLTTHFRNHNLIESLTDDKDVCNYRFTSGCHYSYEIYTLGDDDLCCDKEIAISKRKYGFRECALMVEKAKRIAENYQKCHPHTKIHIKFWNWETEDFEGGGIEMI